MTDAQDAYYTDSDVSLIGLKIFHWEKQCQFGTDAKGKQLYFSTVQHIMLGQFVNTFVLVYDCGLFPSL